MSPKSIAEAAFFPEYTCALHNKNAEVFAHISQSMTSAYIDWKGLPKDIIQHPGLDHDKEHRVIKRPIVHDSQLPSPPPDDVTSRP
jgi:hypothetical protein